MVITYKGLDNIHQQVPHGLWEGHQIAWFMFLCFTGLAEELPQKAWLEELPQKAWLKEQGGSAVRVLVLRQHQLY